MTLEEKFNYFFSPEQQLILGLDKLSPDQKRFLASIVDYHCGIVREYAVNATIKHIEERNILETAPSTHNNLSH
jgi:hypothetical protein